MSDPSKKTPVDICSEDQRELFQVFIHLQEHEKETQADIQSVGCLSQHDAAAWRQYLATKRELETKEKDAARKVVLWDMSLRVPVAGYPINLTALRQNKQLLSIEAQLKFLNGEVNYRADQITPLKEWIQSGNTEVMEEIFHYIHGQRGKQPIGSTDIDQLFAELKQIPLGARL